MKQDCLSKRKPYLLPKQTATGEEQMPSDERTFGRKTGRGMTHGEKQDRNNRTKYQVHTYHSTTVKIITLYVVVADAK